jgi:hypothetical protein
MTIQDIAQANILREERRHRGGGVAFKRCEQRDTALGTYFDNDAFPNLTPELGALKNEGLDFSHTMQLPGTLRVGDRFRRLFIVGHEVRIAVARLGFYKLGDLMKSKTIANPKLNLVYIYGESLERTYFDNDAFPNLTPGLQKVRTAGYRTGRPPSRR